MSRNNSNSDDGFFGGEDGKSQSKYIFSKFEYDLYHEEDNVPGSVVQVKRFGNAKKGEKWKIFDNNKLSLTIDGVKLTSKERSFLYSVDGINFLIQQYKQGVTAISSLKKNMKSHLVK
jgi:hypothetical protein